MDVRYNLRWMSASTMMKLHHFHSTNDQNSKIWCQLGWWNSIRVHPVALETACQYLKHFLYVYYGFGKQSEVDGSLNYDEMASFLLHKLSQVTQNSKIWGQPSSVMI
jgi:hypothetical protein